MKETRELLDEIRKDIKDTKTKIKKIKQETKEINKTQEIEQQKNIKEIFGDVPIIKEPAAGQPLVNGMFNKK